MRLFFIVLTFALLSCEDKVPIDVIWGSDQSPRLMIGATDAGQESHIYVLDWQQPAIADPDMSREAR